MINRVQQTLEELAPELNSYLQKKIFSRKEIAKIIDTRRQFEHKLLRNYISLEYYLDYIESEHKLEKIRNRRMIKNNLRPSATDRLMDINVLNIYRRALKKFVDPVIVKKFVEFCLAKNFHDEMKYALRDVSLRNLGNIDLWVFIAQTFWEINDIEGARNMFLQLISINKNKRVGIEFFRLECLYAEKIGRINKELGIEDDECNVEKGEVALVVFKSILPLTSEEMDECIEISKIVPGLQEQLLEAAKNHK